jgi:hypothetical protein
MTDDDYDALSQKQLASIKRDMRISLEDAAVRATHKVMAEEETSAQRMKEEWLFPGAVVPVDMDTTLALVTEIKRLINVIGGMALAQPAQEPVAWMDRDGDIYKELPNEYWNPPHTPIYTKREWVGLTDEEIEATAKWADKNAAPWHIEFARAIEAKLKEKNA